VHLQASDGELAALRGDREMAGPHLDQLAAGGQARQRGLQRFPLVAFRAQFAHQLLEIGAGVGEARDMVEQAAVGHTPILRSTPGCVRASYD
jgi:hypothetical protein